MKNAVHGVTRVLHYALFKARIAGGSKERKGRVILVGHSLGAETVSLVTEIAVFSLETLLNIMKT